jgi:hypothetical protein
MGVPSVIMSYNAKPVLIRRTGSVFRGGGTNTSITNGGSPSGGSKYLEIDIHVHKFANLAKKSIHALSSRCSLMYMQIGFVIEGRTDEELPETLFACVGVNRPEEDKVVHPLYFYHMSTLLPLSLSLNDECCRRSFFSIHRRRSRLLAPILVPVAVALFSHFLSHRTQ